MKASELRKKSKGELNKTLQDLYKNLGQLRFKLSSNKVKNVREISQIKKDIARILTIMKHKISKK